MIWITLETLYALVIIIPCMVIWWKTYVLYRFSKYKGLAYLGNAFLCLAIAFMLRYIIMIEKILAGDALGTINQFTLLLLTMEVFMILPGLYIVYALVWRSFEKKCYATCRSLFPTVPFVLVASVIAYADLYFQTLLFMYGSLIIFYGLGSIIAIYRYIHNRTHIQWFFVIALVLLFIAMVINFIVQYTIHEYPLTRFIAYIITVVVLFIFVHITYQLTKRHHHG